MDREDKDMVKHEDHKRAVEFLVGVYIGANDGKALEHCVDRAYRDWARTYRGLANAPRKKAVLDKARGRLLRKLEELQRGGCLNQALFDEWHQELCDGLIEDFRPLEPLSARLSYGQAQKWVNMTLKYVFTVLHASCCGEHLAGFAPVWPFCHMPLDSVVLAQLGKEGKCPKAAKVRAWSKMGRCEYRNILDEIRSAYKGPLLVAEHQLWKPGISVDSDDDQKSG
jgi:hypothetical protein